MAGSRRSRSAIANDRVDNIFEAPGRVDAKVTKKIKESYAEFEALKKKTPHGPVENLNGPGLRDPAVRALGPKARAENLSPKQRAYVEGIAREGKSKRRAAYDAGYSTPRTAIQKLETLPAVQKALTEEHQAYEQELGMTRKRVVDGLMEAVDLARIKADPLSMVAGWREVAKICGYYEPVKHKVEVSVNGQVLLHQITNMSDEDLLKLADEANIIDGEFQAISNGDSE